MSPFYQKLFIIFIRDIILLLVSISISWLKTAFGPYVVEIEIVYFHFHVVFKGLVPIDF